MTLPVLFALGAAVMFGWSTAGMHHGASSAPVRQSGWRSLVALLRHVVRQWRWLTGMVASLLGVVLHALALRRGALVVVQPVIVSGLVFSFLFRSALDRRLPARRTMLWSTVTAAALAVFLVAERETPGTTSPDVARAAAVLAGGTLLAAACWWLSGRARASLSGVLLGGGAGVIFGLTAGTLKATAAEAGTGRLLTGWPLYVLVTLGVAGFLANQTAYRRPLSSALPALNVMNPLTALAYGALAFSERPAGHLASLSLAFGSLLVVLFGVVQLVRDTDAVAVLAEPAVPDRPDAAAADRDVSVAA